MIRIVLILACLMIVLPAAHAWSDPQDFQEAAKGRYLATAGDCVACHTAAGGKPFAGGRAIATPFGTILSSNITPDRDTGIGAWTDDEFVRAMRKGIGPGGKHFYPVFPYPYFTTMTRNDVLAVRHYLATIEPVRQAVDANQLPFPFSIRGLMAIWNGLFFKAREFRADPEKSAEWNRGAYLVQGLGHCGDCHSPKNIFGAEKTSEAYQGGNLQGWFAPTVTSDGRVGLGAWTVDAVVEYLHTGHNKNAAASGPMAEVVALSTSRMSLPDLHAMAVWLKDLPGANEEPATAPAKTVMDAGHRVFQAQCGACHGSSGQGVPNLFPGLAGAPDVQSDDFTNLLRVVLQGGKSVATATKPTGPAMPAFGWKLSNEQIADVTTYIRNDWGNAAQAVSASDVAAERRKLRRTP